MGLLNTVGKVVGLDDFVEEIGKTVRQVLPNKEAEREFDLKLEELRQQAEERIHEQMLAQVDVNKTEAQHASIFVAGWRPFIGWVCGVSVGWNFFLAPLLRSLGLTDPGTLQIEYLMTLCVTMLGASGIRTFEIKQGINRDKLSAPRLNESIPPTSPLASNAPVPETDAEENAPWNRK